jgi:GxxExxY protein
MKHENLTGAVIEAGLKVHTALGPGLLEQPYKVCLLHELRKRDIPVRSEVALPVTYDGIRIDIGYRVDLLIEDLIVVEVKAVREIASIHKAQLLSYLRLGDKPVGMLLNFHVASFKQGIHRICN